MTNPSNVGPFFDPLPVLDPSETDLPRGANFVVRRVDKNAGHPTWWLEIPDLETNAVGTVEMQTADLLDRHRFQEIVLTKLNFMLLLLNEHRDRGYVRFVDQVARLTTLG